ncbi:hypothetical protein BH10BAC5_BH10BAC5_16220 [soil metagenome]
MSGIEQKIKHFQELEITEHERDVTKLDDFIFLLEHDRFNSDDAKKYSFTKNAKRMCLILTGIILEIIGFALILLFKADDFTDSVMIRLTPQNGLHLIDILGFSDTVGVIIVGIGIITLIFGLRMSKI